MVLLIAGIVLSADCYGMDVMDSSNDFDTVTHTILKLDILNTGMPDKKNRWICDYFGDHQTFVEGTKTKASDSLSKCKFSVFKC